MAQNPTPEPSAAVKAAIAAQIDQAIIFATKAVANPGLIESTAKSNRATILSGGGAQLLTPAASPVYNTAESLYQIQEDLGLDAAVRAAQVLASLPSLSKGKQ